MGQDEIDSVENSEIIMLKDLINIVIDQAKALPNPLQAMSRDEQQEYIDSAEAQIRASVDAVINAISSRGIPTVIGIVEKVIFKNGAEAVIKFGSINQGVHDLADATKQFVHILIPANPDDLMDDSDLPRGEEDQRTMDLGSEHNDESEGDVATENEDPLYQQAVSFVVGADEVSISSIKRELKVGYNRAARIIESMEEKGIVSEIGSNGVRTVLKTEHE